MYNYTTTGLITKAITERNVIRFFYKGEMRIVEPFTLGYHKDSGNLTLSAYQIGGYSESKSTPLWRLYVFDEMIDITISNQTAAPWRPGYNRKDSRMSSIICGY